MSAGEAATLKGFLIAFRPSFSRKNERVPQNQVGDAPELASPYPVLHRAQTVNVYPCACGHHGSQRFWNMCSIPAENSNLSNAADADVTCLPPELLEENLNIPTSTQVTYMGADHHHPALRVWKVA